MKLNKETLKQIIKEELESMLSEEQSEAYLKGLDTGKLNRAADIGMVDNPDPKVREDYMRGYTDGLAAGGHPPLEPYTPYQP